MSDLTDPTAATSPALKRGAFVALSAAAAAGAATLGPGLTQESQLGKPHPPLVAEDDPAITAGWIMLSRPDKAIRAYTAVPKNATATTPGVVVTMHIWGVDTSIRDCVRRLAKQGYIAVSPDLYDRFGAPSGDGATDVKPFSEIASKLVEAQVDADLGAGANWIKNAHPHSKVGVMGFCMGGSITLRQAVDNPVYTAASVFYGKVRYATGNGPGSAEGPITRMALAYTDEIRIPICGSFGERDTSIHGDDVRAFARRLQALGIAHDIKVYPEAGHAFFDDQRSSYVASAANDAWSRTLAFFAKYLRQ